MSRNALQGRKSALGCKAGRASRTTGNLAPKPETNYIGAADSLKETMMNAQLLMKPAARAAVAFVLAAGLMLPVAAPASAYAATDGAKDEVVYAKASPNGETEGIYVVNVFEQSADGQVSDPANYTSVQNLSTTEALSQQGGSVQATVAAGTPFYYQGNMEATRALPWKISIKYYLDGEEVQPSQLSGANGQLKVVLDVQAATSDAAVSDFAESYILQAQGTFAEDAFSITDAGGATVAHSGSNQVVNCLVLPGESKTFEITGNATNFSCDGWQIAGMSLSMAIDLASEDTSQLTEKTTQLEDATTQLNSGAGTLSSGAGQVSDGASSVAEGAQSLSSGIDQAAAGLSQLSAAGGNVESGWQELNQGISALAQGISQTQQGSSQFQAGVESAAAQQASGAQQAKASQAAYAAAVKQVQTAMAAYQANPTSENLQAVSAAIAEMDSAAQAMAQTASAAGAYQALTSVQDSYAELGEGIDSLNSQAQALPSGASEFASGLSAYLSGADEAAGASTQLQSGAAQLAQGSTSLSGATSQLAQGSASLASGTEALASSVSGLDQKIIDELQATIDEKLGKGFKAHSYVVPSNTNVDAVQFVYVVEGISEPENDAADSADGESSSKSQTIFDRLVALFTSQE